MSAYDVVPVAAPPEAVVTALHEVIRERSLTAYATVDHGHDMAAAGAPGHVAWTLVFGNPAGGAKLLSQDVRAAVDIPLRLAVVGAAPGAAEIVFRDMRSLLGAELAELADAFTAVLRAVAADARERAEERTETA